MSGSALAAQGDTVWIEAFACRKLYGHNETSPSGPRCAMDPLEDPKLLAALLFSVDTSRRRQKKLEDRAIAAEAALGRAVVAGAVPTATPPVPISVPTAPEWIDRPEAARRLGVHVQTLDALINGTPRTLPGAPTIVGHGGKRRHYRFHADSLAEWAAAARDYRARTGRRGAPRVRQDRDKS